MATKDNTVLVLFQKFMVGPSVATIIVRASSLGVRVICLLMLASAVSPELFGTVAVAMSVVEITRAFFDFGLDTLSIREYALATDSDAEGKSLAHFAACKVICGT